MHKSIHHSTKAAPVIRRTRLLTSHHH